MTLKGILLFSIFCILVKSVAAQPTSNDLSVPKYSNDSLSSLLHDLKVAEEDTGKVKILIKISSKYYRKASIAVNYSDSCLFYGYQAAILSKSLKDPEGHNEATFLICKALLDKKDFQAATLILKEVYGEQRIRLLLALSEYYIFMQDVGPEVLRKAYPYLKMANTLSEKQRSRHWMTESSIAMAKYHFRLGEISEGKECFYKVIQYHEKMGDRAGAARWWQDLGLYIPGSDSTYATVIYSFQKARALYKELGKTSNEAECLQMEAFVHSVHDRSDLAEKLLFEGLQVLKSDGVNKSWKLYSSLSDLYKSQGNFNKALRYALMSLENLKSLDDTKNYFFIYLTLGDIYRSLDDYPNSIKFYKLYFSNRNPKAGAAYFVARSLIDVEIKSKTIWEGLTFIRSFQISNPPRNLIEKQLIAEMFGNCYNALKNFKLAEKYYLEMIRLDEEIESSESHWFSVGSSISGSEAYFTIGKFYTERGNFNLADRYVKRALTAKNLTPVFERDIRLLQFKVDSSAGNYIRSISNYQRYSYLKDSIESIAKNKEIAVLKIKFEASQKESDIKLLKKEAMLQKRQLELSERTEKFTYAGIIALLGMLALSYNRYRLKQNKNLQLEEQQTIIKTKNSSLKQLVNEKEWLLKEVHHRVKNNLQIVISLLNSQSAYLKDDVAINAILESRHRIQAMSMLHQKIYQSENMASIAMTSYIHELVYYLNHSFSNEKRIRFNLSIEDINLDLVQAVPIGLILNEAITNSLKYAFPNNREGQIQILFHKTLNEELVLSIADDGIGLPADFKLKESKSFGLKLINGLTEDLDGELMIQSLSGTTLTIQFSCKPALDSFSAKDILDFEL